MSNDNAAFTIDLTGGADATPAAKVGRVIVGVLLMILGVLIAAASLAAFVGGAFVPALVDWYDWISDGILVIGIIGCVLVYIGFELVRRTRKKQRAADAAEAAAVMADMKETKPPIAGPTIT